MLKTFIDGRTLPRCIIPVLKGGSLGLFAETVSVYCVRPITLEIPSDTDKQPMGYNLKLTNDWVKKI
jgi:hypothetical protein